jgi:hypothetical protein
MTGKHRWLLTTVVILLTAFSACTYVPQTVEVHVEYSVRNWVPSPDGRENMHDVWLLE